MANLIVNLLLSNQSARQLSNQVANSLNDSAKKWRDSVKEMTARGFEAGFQTALSSGKSGSAIQKFLQTNITDVYSKFQKELNAGNLEAAERLERILDKRTRRFEREAKAQVDAFEAMNARAARTWSEKADTFRSTVDDINRSMHMRDPSGYLGIGRQLGGRIQEAGRARMERARRIKDAGEDPAKAQRMATMGKAMAGIGASLVTVAALAAAVLALIKLFMDLNDRIVDMNKAILQTGTVTDMGIGGRAWEAGHKFNQELGLMREQILDAASELDGFRVSSEEMFQTVGALNEYGRGFEKIRDQIDRGAKHLQDYGDAAEMAIGYAKLMGQTSQEMAQNISRWANDFGQDYERVYEGLSAVRQEAMLSGFSMKRFVGTIVEATSGMGAYAVRLEEAGKMLKFLSNMMGETAGAELFKSLTNAFTEASTSDRLKRILTTGQDEMARIFEDQARSNAESLMKDLEAAGYKGTITSGDELVKKLAGMNEDERLAMMAQLKAGGYEAELIQRMDNLMETVRAGQGDLAAMVNAMSDLGPAGTLATLTQSQVFGGRMLHEFVAEEGAAGRAAAEQMTGRTGKAFEALVDASRSTSADMLALRRIQSQVLNEGRTLSKEEQMAMAELYGATVTQTGEIVGATADLATNQVEMGDKITDEQGLMLAQNDRYKKAEEEAVTEDIKLAREIAQSTEKLANVMEANMLKILNKIYKTVYDFWMDFLRLIGKEDPGEQARVGAANRLVAQGSKMEQYLAENAKREKDLKSFLENEQDPILKAGAEKQLKVLVDTDKKIREMIEVNDMARDFLANMDTTGKTQAEVLKELEAKLAEEGYDLGVNTLDENAARNVLNEIGSKTGWGQIGSAFENMAEEEGFQKAAGAVATYAAEEAGITDSTVIAQAARNAARQAEEGGASWKEAMPVIEAAITREITKATQDSPLENIMNDAYGEIQEITTNTYKAAEAAKDQNAALAGATPAGDFILRPGSKPIITDPNDTVMGFKPGGPIAAATGGGGKSPVNVNIYGGDPKKVYNEVMRVMKALGHA